MQVVALLDRWAVVQCEYHDKAQTRCEAALVPEAREDRLRAQLGRFTWEIYGSF